MRRHHIAIFTNLGNGHVYPSLGLCSELLKRGYRVTYATNDYYAPRIQQTGAEPVIYSPATYRGPNVWQEVRGLSMTHPKWWQIYASAAFPYFMDDVSATLPQLEPFYRDNAPDLIIYDRFAFVGRILAHRLGCPSTLISFCLASYKQYFIRLNGTFMTPEPMIEFSNTLDSFLASYGIEEVDNLYHIEKLNVYFLPRILQYQANWYDDRFCFIGASLNRPFQRTWENSSNGKPILLISGMSDGIDTEYFKLFIDALAGADYHVILSVGRQIADASLGPIPENFEINRDRYHLEMLPYTALTICQVGIGTILESIHHGVPIIAIPPTPFTEETAVRLVELGIGLHLPRLEMTVETIRDSVSKILGDTSIATRVTHMQQIFRASGGVAEAADRLDGLLGIRPSA